MDDDHANEWQLWWDARLEAMKGVLGTADDIVGHAAIPFELGAELGGAADVVYFRGHRPGIVAVTSELIGNDSQLPNAIGNYELMICDRQDIEWGAGLISRLALYTVRAAIEPGETMDIAEAAPPGSTISAFLFYEYARFVVRRQRCGLLLCVGITADELEACHAGLRRRVDAALRAAGVYPYTDLYRGSTLTRH